jgi:microsomal dipeptidase-like Zn-dependent dipeptidase
MKLTCRFAHARWARSGARTMTLVLALSGASPGVAYASDVTPPEPAPVRTPIVGFADTHVHQFSNLAFGGLEVWGSPVDPTFDAVAYLANPAAAAARALPDSDFVYLTSAQAADYLGPADAPAIVPPLGEKCDDGHCWDQCPAGTGVSGNPCWRIAIHGDGGNADLLNNVIAGPSGHGIRGYPDFDGWPSFDIVTAQQVYWEWLKRAHDRGMKLMAMLAVNNAVLCRLGPHRASFGCGDDDSVTRQIQGAKDLERYIDSVSGGPGMGFYKIVYNSAEARDAIDNGKLAVVLGVEVDTPWGCTANAPCSDDHIREEVQRYADLGIRVVYPVHLIDNAFGGTALYDSLFELDNLLVNGTFYDITSTCDARLQWRSGLRKDISAAKDDVTIAIAALIGAGPLLPVVIPIAVPVLTAAVPVLSAALPQLALFVPVIGLLYPEVATLAGILTPLATVFLSAAAVPVVAALAVLIMQAPGEVGTAPSPNCNNRELQHAGNTLINELMDRRMIIDVDHTDARTLDAILTMAETRHYPGIVSGHTGLTGTGITDVESGNPSDFEYDKSGRHEGTKTDEMVSRIVALGGTISLALAQGGRAKIRDFDPNDGIPYDCGGSSQVWAQTYLYATKKLHLTSVSFGSDLNGFSTWPTPRYGIRACGTLPGSPGDFGPSYDPAHGFLDYGTATDYYGVSLGRYHFGNRTWDYNFDGFAHVGLYPDFIADLQKIGLSHADLAPLFNGVEAYVRMWEKVDDDQAPTVRCGTVGEDWHADDVSVPCIAFDTGWDLANPADASFTLSTSVADGTETDNAFTGTHAAICDAAHQPHCTTTIPAISGINVDKKAPAVTVVSPAAGTPTFVVNQVVAADYSCRDDGSGIATCDGPIAAGANLDTTTGAHAFTVTATDRVNHLTSVSHPYNVAFAVCALYDSTVTKKAGSTVPIKLQLCDAGSANLSAASIPVHAVGVTRMSTNTPVELANPDFDFRYDATLGGYIFNLSTKGFSAGTYALLFTAGNDPTTHTATFAVR